MRILATLTLLAMLAGSVVACTTSRVYPFPPNANGDSGSSGGGSGSGSGSPR